MPRDEFGVDYSFYAESAEAARASIVEGTAAPYGVIFCVNGVAIEAMG